MKHLIVLGIFLSSAAYADVEYKEGQSFTPPKKELSVSRGCFREIDELGCGHPAQDQGYFNTCLAEKQADLSVSCRAFFEKLYGKKKL